MENMELMVVGESAITSPRVDDILQAFLSGRSERTVEAYRHDLEDFRRFLGVDDPGSLVTVFLGSDLGSANVTALRFRSFLIEQKLQPTTINRKLAALRSLSALARTCGLITWKLEIANLKTEKYRDTRGPGTGGVKSMLNITERRGDAKGTRDQAIWRLLYDLGLRRGELTALDLEDLDLKERTIQVVGKGKLQKEKTLTLPEKTAQAIKLWLEVRGIAPGPLFTNADHARKGDGRITGRSVHRIIKDLGAQAGLKTRPHGLRHTAITQAVKKAQEAGMGIEAAMDFSRHKDVKTLMIYNDRLEDKQGKLADLVADTI